MKLFLFFFLSLELFVRIFLDLLFICFSIFFILFFLFYLFSIFLFFVTLQSIRKFPVLPKLRILWCNNNEIEDLYSFLDKAGKREVFQSLFILLFISNLILILFVMSLNFHAIVLFFVFLVR